jgi:hypothetical protein
MMKKNTIYKQDTLPGGIVEPADKNMIHVKGVIMKKFIYPVLLSTLGVFLFSSQSEAFQCVTTGAEFQIALTAAIAGDNDIRLESGTFTIANNADGNFQIVTDQSLTISGGWDTGCVAQTAVATILDGNNIAQDELSEPGGGVLSVAIEDNLALATLSISDVTSRNGLSVNDGGGLSIIHDELDPTVAFALTVNISNVIAESNSTEYFGSGISIVDYGTDGGMSITIADSIVRDNVVPVGSSGGPAGIFIDNYGLGAGAIAITRNQILNNVAEWDGGGLLINSGPSNATLVNNVIAGNYVTDAGALCESSPGVPAPGNCDIGGGVYIENVDGASVTLTNNTITGNGADGFGGGGVFVQMDNPASVLNIYNNIIYNNRSLNVGALGVDLYIFNLGVTVNLYNNDFNNLAAGFYILENTPNFNSGNNLNNVDPLFANVLNDNYRLSPTSPVINRGDNVAPAVPADDLDGKVRPLDGIVDMGAYEYGVPELGVFFVLPNQSGGAAVIFL